MHFDRLKCATLKRCLHKLSKSELERFSSNAEQEDLSDYTPVHRQLVKPVSAKIDAPEPQAPLKKQNARTVTPSKAEPAIDAPKAFKAPKVEAPAVEKQAAPANQEGPGPGSEFELTPFIALKSVKAKKLK